MRSIFDVVRKEFRKLEEYHPESGTCLGVYHYFEQNLHRDDGPAILAFNAETGQKEQELWFRHGVSHRLDGPASVWWSAGKAILLEWHYVGNLHRSGGLPARIAWAHDAETIIEKDYFEYGRRTGCRGPL